MGPLARLWTFTGQLFIPLALAWAVYARGGLAEAPPLEGVRVSRAYAGFLLALAAGAVLAWTAAMYVAAAKRSHRLVLVPPNTTLEEGVGRNIAISWATAVTFSIAVLLAIVEFATTYSYSQIHAWDCATPLQNGFWASRVQAHHDPCPSRPCFALGQRTNPPNRPLNGVFEYIPFVTDGALLIFAITFASGLGAVVLALRKPTRPFV